MKVKDLLFLTKTTNSRLILKLILYSLSVYFCFFSFWGYFFLFLVLIYAYFSSIERIYFKAGFASLFFLNFLLINYPISKLASFFISLSLFFLLISVSDFVFFNRKIIYSFFNILLFLLFIFLIFKSPIRNMFLIGTIFFILSFYLSRENLIFYFNSFYRRFNLISLSLSFVFIQFFSLFNILKISYLYEIFLLSLIYIYLKDFSIFYLEGEIDSKKIIFYSLCGLFFIVSCFIA